MRVLMFLVFCDFSKIYRALESKRELGPERASSRNCGELEANTLCMTGVSAVSGTSLGVPKA